MAAGVYTTVPLGRNDVGYRIGNRSLATATSAAYARTVRAHADAAVLAAFVIVVASTVAAARVIVEVAIVSPSLMSIIAAPLGLLLALMLLMSLTMARRSRPRNKPLTEGSAHQPRGALSSWRS